MRRLAFAQREMRCEMLASSGSPSFSKEAMTSWAGAERCWAAFLAWFSWDGVRFCLFFGWV